MRYKRQTTRTTAADDRQTTHRTQGRPN